MEGKALVLLPHGGLTAAAPCVREKGVGLMKRMSHMRRKRCSTVRAFMVRPQETAPAPARETAAMTVYRDNWFDKLAIGYLSRNLQEASGIKNEKDGYESLIEATLTISRIFRLDKQCEIVTNALERALPSYILAMIKVMMPPSGFSREYFAFFTTIFFPWLVGPCEVRESEVDGRREKNVVYIPKCRFLESTNCVGMCTNLCKIPCEKFIHDSLGMTVYMSPNFEDMSCEMIFGQLPPDDDPAMKQPFSMHGPSGLNSNIHDVQGSNMCSHSFRSKNMRGKSINQICRWSQQGWRRQRRERVVEVEHAGENKHVQA